MSCVILLKKCRLDLFQDSDFAGEFEDSKSTSGGTLCIFGSHTIVPISWMCKRQTAVSPSSTESEIISLDTGLRLDGLPALELWDLIVSVLGNVSRVSDRSGQPDKTQRKIEPNNHTKSPQRMDDHQFKEEEKMSQLENCLQFARKIVLQCLFLTRIGRPDILWSLNNLARAVTKWTKACDKRLTRLISYIHHTCEYRQYCYLGNSAQQCR